MLDAGGARSHSASSDKNMLGMIGGHNRPSCGPPLNWRAQLPATGNSKTARLKHAAGPKVFQRPY
jgi:hypothetical protein